MMTIQARETFIPHYGAAHPLRVYPINSPRAKARLIALALLADGKLAREELEVLGESECYWALGISRQVFFEVMADFCTDLASLPVGEGGYQLTPATLEGLLAEVRSPAARRAVIGLMLDVIFSDGKLDTHEHRLLRQALDTWNIRLADSASQSPLHRHAPEGPEHYYG